jgi:hypothetical protein
MVKNFKILSVPTYIVLKDGEEVHRANWSKDKRTVTGVS